MSAWRRVDRRVWTLVLLLALAGVVVQRRKQVGAPRAAAPSVAASPAPALAAEMALPEPVAWEVAPILRRDPFETAPAPRRAPRARVQTAAPPAAAPETPRVPQVQILLLDPERPLALVDNRRVAVGDSIGGYRVVGIDAAGVTLERGGMRITARP